MKDKISAADKALASRHAVSQADDMVRTIGSMLRITVWLLDNRFADDERPKFGPTLDDLARQIEAGYELCDRVRAILEVYGLSVMELGSFERGSE